MKGKRNCKKARGHDALEQWMGTGAQGHEGCSGKGDDHPESHGRALSWGWGFTNLPS